MSRVVVNEIQAKIGNDITFNDAAKIDTAKIDTLKGKTTAGSVTVQGEGSATTNLQIGLAKYFVHYVQGTDTINKSFNSSSISDDAAGMFTINYTNAFADANYGLNSGIGANTTDAQSNRGGHSIGFTNGGTPTTSSAPINYLYGASQSNASTDIDTTSYHTLYGDLA